MARDPFCGNCGYSLVGLTESSKCPECGKPIVEVLQRETVFKSSKRFKSDITLFGLPLLHIAFGPHDDEHYGKARGIIAIGNVAVGWLAIGGRAFGLITFGGLSIGVVSFGGASIGLLAMGGGAVGGAALGGGAFGGLATGGGAVGFVATGGGAWGYYARGGSVQGKYVIGPNRRDPQALKFFNARAWLFGADLRGGLWNYPTCMFAAAAGFALLLAIIAALAYVARGRKRKYR